MNTTPATPEALAAMREEFEADYEQRFGHRPTLYGDDYVGATAFEWDGWQAATLRVVQPQEEEYVQHGMTLAMEMAALFRAAPANLPGNCLAEYDAKKAALRSHLSMRLQAPTDDEQSCWLVEKREDGRTVAYLGHACGSYEWMPTADQATRFVRREDANGVAACMERDAVIVAEHIWG